MVVKGNWGGWGKTSLGLPRGVELLGVTRTSSPYVSRARQSSWALQDERGGGLVNNGSKK